MIRVSLPAAALAALTLAAPAAAQTSEDGVARVDDRATFTSTHVIFRVQCAGPTTVPCTGSAVLRTRGPVRVRPGAVRRVLRFGGGAYELLPPGGAQTYRIRLIPRARAWLRGRKDVGVLGVTVNPSLSPYGLQRSVRLRRRR